MDYKKLAELIFPDVKTSPEELEAKYPERNLPEGARVTRVAPSPTGFIHLGGLYQALIDSRLAKQSGGVFYLRIEDTDRKRLVEGAVDGIIKTFADYGIEFDEGATASGDKGAYGPYRQSERREVYRVYAKKLMSEGRAYPCFCTPEKLEEIHALQTERKDDPGYYGKYAVCRDLSYEEVEEKVKAGTPFTVRFRSEGDKKKTVPFKDEIKGDLLVPQNDNDFVLLKSDGLPTYHLAHAVDDHLMRTSLVVRGEEWLSTLPYHLELFYALGFKRPKYAHTAHIMKNDGGGKRKLSKRHDPEAAVSYYFENGYTAPAVKEYLYGLISSSFEEWRRSNKGAAGDEFPLSLKKMSVSGCLFDTDKLNDVSRTVLSELSADELYKTLEGWAPVFEPKLYEYMKAAPEKIKAIISIGRGGGKPRKDLTTLRDALPYVSYFFEDGFEPSDDAILKSADAKEILKDYLSVYSEKDDRDGWFGRIRDLSERHGYCPDMKRYKAEPEKYKGSVSDVSSIIRLAVTGRVNTPDMYEVMQILGKETVLKRIKEETER